MKVAKGYKLTDVGVIPHDWEIIRLGDIAEIGSGGTPNRKMPQYWNGKIPWVTTSLIDFNVVDSAEEFITKKGLKNSATKILPQGTLLMAMYGQGKTRGKIAMLGIDATINQACASIKLKQQQNSEYIFYNLSFRYNEIRGLSNSENQENLSGNIIKGILIPFPPTIEEQNAITQALNETDAFIADLEKLIAKKQNIKQATMQVLLTGKKRLKGFSGEWQPKKLSELLDYEQPVNYLVKNTEYNTSTGIPVLTANKSFILGYTDEMESVFEKVPVIIFDDFTTASRFVTFPFKVKSSAIKILKPKNKEVDLRFVFEKIQRIKFAIGDHKRYYISEYQNILIDTPSPDEQKEISRVINDMDSEIEALQKRLSKFKLMKEGMMQNLLTGKVRLV